MKKSKEKNEREGTLAILAAMLVLFSAMWDPIISVVISLAAIILFIIYKFTTK
jgi:hypothetical protein